MTTNREISKNDLLQMVYDEFSKNLAWPFARELQRQLKDAVNVRRLAAEIGTQSLVCYEGGDGVCLLTLQGIAQCSGSETDIGNYLAMIRFVSRDYLKSGPREIKSDEICLELGINESDCRRLGLMMSHSPGVWGTTGHSPDQSTFSLKASEDAAFCENVSTLEEFLAVKRRLQIDGLEAARLLFSRQDPAESQSSPRDQIPAMGVLGDWIVLRPLGEGGQGNVSVVVRRHEWPIERIVDAIKNLVPEINSAEQLDLSKLQLSLALEDFVRGKHGFGALKQLKEPSTESKARLQIEVDVYDAISDPHLLEILDKDLSQDWIVTEFHSNGTLHDRLPFFRGDAIGSLEAIRPLANVLARIHSKGFVHRDFKPGNIFVRTDGRLVLGDAGLAFYKDDSDRPTKTYESVGTQHYMPAWAYGRRLNEINPTFDLFSVGKVIWAMVAGETACPLWYVQKGSNNLSVRYPDRPEMHWINELLKKCVVEEESAMQINDGTALVGEIDATIRAIRSRTVPPSEVLRIRSCKLCSVGTYEEDNRGHRGQIGMCYRCNRCGHLEFFSGPFQ